MEYSIITFMLLFALAFVGASFYTGVESVWQKLQTLTPSMWCLILSLSFLNYTARCYKWHLFGKKIGIHVPLKRLALYYFSGMSMTVTPGKVGTGIRIWFLNRCHGVRYAKSLPLMIMDPITDLAALLLLCIAGAVGFTQGGEVLSVITFSGLTLIALIILNRPKLFLGLIKGTYKLFGKRKKRLFATLQHLAKNVTNLVTPAIFAQTTALSLLGWTSMSLSFYLILQQMGASDISFLQSAFIFSFSIILGSATMSPGGLGGTEASMILLLMAVGIPQEIAIPATVVIRFTTLWFGVLIGFCHLPFAMKVAKKNS